MQGNGAANGKEICNRSKRFKDKISLFEKTLDQKEFIFLKEK